MPRAQLVETYISSLPLVEVAIVGAGLQCMIRAGSHGEIAPGEIVQHRYFFKSSHAELVLLTIGPEGLSGKPAATLAASIEQAAAKLGAKWQTSDALRKAAEVQVAEIVERVKASGQHGALKPWNTRYRQYRLAQVEKREPAIPYSAFLEQFVITPTVRSIAARAG
ncbi:MAG TPA: hypothetical protein VNX23_24160 [Bradyrhizobium sp.]|uniref:hypothetical protein n=1 Tax=Bradyrhizobium sp. TaxID=376 RepID=UPI002B8F7898|nr:hypothetical protein [Bradyrhizobium sp.]HXB80462.1 hypothetical protein [Bradyrhizobium sp.]